MKTFATVFFLMELPLVNLCHTQNSAQMGDTQASSGFFGTQLRRTVLGHLGLAGGKADLLGEGRRLLMSGFGIPSFEQW